MKGFDDSKLNPEVVKVLRERPYNPADQVPYDPESGIFAGESAAEQAFGGLALPTIQDAIALPGLEPEAPEVGELLKDEAKALVSIVQDFGLPEQNVDRLIMFFERPNLFNFVSSPANDQGQVSLGESIVVNPATGETTVNLAPQIVHNFIADAREAITPVNGDQEIIFARDTGVKMAGMYALSMLCFEVLKRQTAHADPKAVADLFDTGHEDMPKLDDALYANFLPYRLAARLAITRLARLVTLRYGYEDGIEVPKKYGLLRERAFSGLQRASYGGSFSFDDMATARPLSEDSTAQFMRKLPRVTKLYSLPEDNESVIPEEIDSPDILEV